MYPSFMAVVIASMERVTDALPLRAHTQGTQVIMPVRANGTAHTTRDPKYGLWRGIRVGALDLDSSVVETGSATDIR
jgi:hypothetical protein